MNLKLDDWVQGNIYFLGKYEQAELTAIQKLINEGDVFLDIGGNIGLYSLLLSKSVGKSGKIFSFEPFSTNYTLFKEHIHLNKFTNIRLEKMAIGETSGKTNIYYNETERNTGMATTQKMENAIKEEVDIISIDEYVRLHSLESVDAVKIDIEGGEYPTLLGMKETLENFHPLILIEVLSDDIRPKVFLENMGYKQHYIQDNGDLSDYPTNLNRKNYMFIKNIDNKSFNS